MWFLLTLLFFKQSWCEINKGLFVKSSNISLTNWTASVQVSTFVTQTLTECGSYCLQHDSSSYESNNCNHWYGSETVQQPLA